MFGNTLLANDLIIEALEENRAMTAGDALNATDAAKAVSGLNRLIDTQNIGRGNIFTEILQSYTLTIGQQTYTIGTDPAGVQTATLAGNRPNKLTRANLLLSTASNTVRRKINLLTKIQWSKKAVQNIAGMPLDLYDDMAFPLSTWYFYQTPDQAYPIETYSWAQQAGVGPIIGNGTVTTAGTAVTWVSGPEFTLAQQGAGIVINGVSYLVATYVSPTALTLAGVGATNAAAVSYVTGGIATLLSIPPGYYEYWMLALAIRLATPFGKKPTDATMALYMEAKEAVQSLNCLSPRISSDEDFGGERGDLYNWLSGDSEPY